jgi:hypothetical protein
VLACGGLKDTDGGHDGGYPWCIFPLDIMFAPPWDGTYDT